MDACYDTMIYGCTKDTAEFVNLMSSYKFSDPRAMYLGVEKRSELLSAGIYYYYLTMDCCVMEYEVCRAIQFYHDMYKDCDPDISLSSYLSIFKGTADEH